MLRFLSRVVLSEILFLRSECDRESLMKRHFTCESFVSGSGRFDESTNIGSTYLQGIYSKKLRDLFASAVFWLGSALGNTDLRRVKGQYNSTHVVTKNINKLWKINVNKRFCIPRHFVAGKAGKKYFSLTFIKLHISKHHSFICDITRCDSTWLCMLFNFFFAFRGIVENMAMKQHLFS